MAQLHKVAPACCKIVIIIGLIFTSLPSFAQFKTSNDSTIHTCCHYSVFSKNEQEYWSPIPIDSPDYHIIIYNRWGEMVFSSTEAVKSWDGNKDGKLLPQGTYYYILHFRQYGKDCLEMICGAITLMHR